MDIKVHCVLKFLDSKDEVIKLQQKDLSLTESSLIIPIEDKYFNTIKKIRVSINESVRPLDRIIIFNEDDKDSYLNAKTSDQIESKSFEYIIHGPFCIEK